MKAVLVTALMLVSLAGHGTQLEPQVLTAPGVEITELWSADFLLSDAARPPDAAQPWQEVQLPDRWVDPERYTAGSVGWYRFELPQTREPGERFALYVWRYNMALEVWLNDDLLTSTGRFEEPVTRNWNYPLLVELPSSAWRDGRNVVYLRLYGYPHYGAMAPVFLGPLEPLQDAWRLRSFVQNDLSTMLLVLTVTLAIISLAFWVPRRRDSVYLYFSLSSLAYSIYSLNLVVRHVPVSGETWWWIAHMAMDWWVVLLAIFAHRLVGIRRPTLERIFIGFAITTSVVNGAADLPTFAVICNLLHIGALAIAIYLMVFLVGQWRSSRRSDLLAFAVGMFALVVLGAHDMVMNSLVKVEMWRYGFFLLNLGAPLVFLALMWHLARRYVEALQETEAANVHLEDRVQEARSELEASYAERRQLELSAVAATERERIYRDLHDDVGARLLSLIYASQDDGAREAAREALRELRETVSRSRTEPREVEDLMEELCAETRLRVEAAGMEFEDDVRLAGSPVDLPAVQAWHLARIVRETVSNALKHSGGTRLAIRANWAGSESDSALRIEIRDDGCGLPEARGTGRGLRGIEERAEEIGAALQWRNDDGCTLLLDVPITAPIAAPQAVTEGGAGL